MANDNKFTANQIKTLATSPKARKVGLWFAGGMAVLGLTGLVVAPPMLKSLIETKASEALHRKVSLGGFRLNPYTLGLTVEKLSIADNAGGELLGFDEFYANAELSSLFKGGVVIEALQLKGPRVKVARVGEDKFDISDLIDEFSQPKAGAEAAPKSDKPALFSVNNIEISNGRLVLDDRFVGKQTEISELSLKLPFISNLPHKTDIYVTPHLAAKVDGAPLTFAGSTKPFAKSHESELKLDLDRFNVAAYRGYLPKSLPVKLESGVVESDLKLVFKAEDDKPSTMKVAGEVQLLDFAVAEPSGQPLSSFKQLAISLTEADLVGRKVDLHQVALSGLHTQIRKDANGRINLLALGEGGKTPAKPAAAPAADKGANRAAPASPWQVNLEKLLLKEISAQFDDLGLKPTATQVVALNELEVSQISLAPGSKMPFSGKGSINKTGEFKLAGSAQLTPLQVDMQLDTLAIPLIPVQPYINQFLTVSLTGGQISSKGKVSVAPAKGGGNAIGYQGELTIGGFTTVDKSNNTDFLNWKSLNLSKMDVKTSPLAVNVGEVALSDFYSRLIVTPEGKLNVAQMVKKEGKDEKAAKAGDDAPQNSAPDGAAPKPEAARKTEAEKPVVPIKIGKVTLQGGTVNFSDRFVKPNYSAKLGKVNGRITNLSSTPGTMADMDVKAVYDTAPVSIVAKLNPLAAMPYLDLDAKVEGIEMSTMSPYSGKYAGYNIEKGKLSVFVKYNLENNQLKADNRVYLDQLTFGEKVESPTATSLPVNLAISLLKDSRGVIDINLPISGSLDDPQFSIGGIIVKVIINLFVKAVTSPFALLGSLFGGGEELSNVAFAPGSDVLDANGKKRLESLSKALGDRPALKLEITGRGDPEADKEGLKRVAMERAMKAQKADDVNKGRKDAGAIDAIKIEPEEYSKYLTRAYKAAKFPKPRNMVGMQKDLPNEEMEKLMLTNTPVDDDGLQDLAKRRAVAIQSWLVEQGKVPADRVFLLAPKVAKDDKGATTRVDFSLK